MVSYLLLKNSSTAINFKGRGENVFAAGALRMQ